MLTNLLFVFCLFLAKAFAAPGEDCSLTFVVNCEDCAEGEKVKAEIYAFTPDGIRAQMAMKMVKSGEFISSGKLRPGRRTLVIKDQEFATASCDGQDETMVLSYRLHAEPDMDLLPPEPPPVPPSAPLETGLVTPDYHPAASNSDDLVPDFTESDDGAEEDEGEEPVVAPPPLPEPQPEPALVVDNSSSVPIRVGPVPHKVGWATAGSLPVWTGNAGDYPSVPEANRRGRFADSGVTQCPSGKLPAVLGTADSIRGGRPAQDALDDQRAKDLAPPDWNGAYAFGLATGILGDQAAAVWCILPSELNPTSPEGREMVAAAAQSPAVSPGVTPEALHQALEDQEKKLREELKPPEEPPVTAAASTAPFLTRGGPFTGVQWSVGQPNFHWLLGGFVTLRLSDRIWFEPWVAAGTDGKSIHPSGWDEERSMYTETTGTYLAISGGVSFPVVVWEGSKGLTLLLTPSLSWVGDDLTAGVTTWGDTFSTGAQAELWWGREVPFAIYAEAGVGANAWSNDQEQHQWAVRVPVKAGIKVPF